MTPEEAIKEQGWHAGYRDGTRAADLLDKALAAFAALRWEYAVEVRPDEESEWQHTGPWWDTIEKARAWRGRAVIRIGQPYPQDRIVRRPFGPREVVEASFRTVEGHN